ncbi:MAG: hypothetical protein HZA02_02070 [Nitrospinae bacterium]|nr:hypothetical protein [Nitrospinota bacterium]
MKYSKKIICLANSNRHNERCVAGKEALENGVINGWIRPISARPGAELSRQERCYENGVEPRVLDIINILILESKPHSHQTENHLIDHSARWTKKGVWPWEDLEKIVDTPSTLWINDGSSYYGMNDRIPAEQASSLLGSLTLIKLKSLVIQVAIEGKEFGNPRRRVRASFEYHNEYYDLVVTDPVVEEEFLARTDSNYPLSDAYLCISLGEIYEGYCYKLVAAVIRKPR